MSRLRAVCSCAVVFAGLKLATDLFHTAYYGIPIAWSAAVVGAVVIAVTGSLGYLGGLILVRRGFSVRVTLIIAVFGYFVSYSVTRLLEGTIDTPWLFLASVFLVTMFVAARLGPKWQASMDLGPPES